MPYFPHTEAEIRSMLQTVGLRSVEELFRSIPADQRAAAAPNLPPSLPEQTLRRHMGDIAARNDAGEGWRSFLGGGCYPHFIPSAVDEIASRSEFLTPYTPYQPELSQGTLQTAFEY